MIHSRSVRFNEDQMWFLTNSPTKGDHPISNWHAPNAWFPTATDKETDNADNDDPCLEDAIDEIHHDICIDVAIESEDDVDDIPAHTVNPRTAKRSALDGTYWTAPVYNKRNRIRALACTIIGGVRITHPRQSLTN